MSLLLADIDATITSLGYDGGDKYYIERDVLASVKHLIWILRRDNEVHEYRRHIGRSKVLSTDLLPMLIHYSEETELMEVVLRLLVNLTTPALLLYRQELPKDGPGRRNFLEIIEILQEYKQAFTSKPIWDVLSKWLQKNLETDVALRSEEQGLIIERILALIRNILQVPVNPDTEKRADNDASVHDQILWSLQHSDILNLVLYILASEYENNYYLHALEIVYLMYREQSAETLSSANLQRSIAEKYQDEQELTAIRKREKQKFIAHPPSNRHSRFGGSYVLKDVKSLSENDMIYHKPLEKAFTMDIDSEKLKKKKSHRIVKEENVVVRRSAFSVRLFLREFCIEVLRSAYNLFVRNIRRILERDSYSTGHDDSYLLWAIDFFMAFNRLTEFKLELVSESLSISCFHWILTRIQHNLEMITSDKKNANLWSRRLHIAVKAYRELLNSLNALQNFKDDKSLEFFKMIQNNIFYVLEYRETMLHLLIQYNESKNTKAYLRDVIETAHIFFKMLEKFCSGGVVVQQKKRRQNKQRSKKSSKSSKEKNQQQNDDQKEEDLDATWTRIMPQLATILSQNDLIVHDGDEIIPFDAASEKSIDDQKGDCMLKIFGMLKEEQFEHAVLMLRAGREVWTEDDCFGSYTSAPEDELMILKDIFFSNLVHKKESDELNEFEESYEFDESDEFDKSKESYESEKTDESNKFGI